MYLILPPPPPPRTAALLIQGSAVVYSKKVEYLYDLIIQAIGVIQGYLLVTNSLIFCLYLMSFTESKQLLPQRNDRNSPLAEMKDRWTMMKICCSSTNKWRARTLSRVSETKTDLTLQRRMISTWKKGMTLTCPTNGPEADLFCPSASPLEVTVPVILLNLRFNRSLLLSFVYDYSFSSFR